jgi:hypothetical protein
MIRRSLGTALAVAITLAWADWSAARAEPPTAAPQRAETHTAKPSARPHEIIALLRTKTDLTGLPETPTLKHVLDLLTDRLTARAGKEVRTALDMNAFKAETPEMTSECLLELEVRFPERRQSLELGAVLRRALKQIPTNNATFLIRLGQVEVTTVEAAHPAQLLQQTVAATFNRRPLEEVLEELSDLTGASIVLDPRLADRQRARVTATFRNDTSLAAVLRMVGDMTDVRFVIVEGGLYATTPARASRLMWELGYLPAPPVVPRRVPGAY